MKRNIWFQGIHNRLTPPCFWLKTNNKVIAPISQPIIFKWCQHLQCPSKPIYVILHKSLMRSYQTKSVFVVSIFLLHQPADREICIWHILMIHGDDTISYLSMRHSPLFLKHQSEHQLTNPYISLLLFKATQYITLLFNPDRDGCIMLLCTIKLYFLILHANFLIRCNNLVSANIM